jgi:hypothetical protein
MMVLFVFCSHFSHIHAHTHSKNEEMMNFFLTPTSIKCESRTNNKDNYSTIPTKIPQNFVSDKETFNERTKKSLLKINLFIKRLKWFNIFTATTTNSNQQTNSKVQKATEIEQHHQKQQQQQYYEQRKWYETDIIM